MTTFGAGVGLFALGWWLCDVRLAMDTGNALGIAALPSGLATTLLGWWAGREDTGTSQARPVMAVGPIPREPQHFQPPKHVLAALEAQAKSKAPAVVCSVTGQRGVGKTQAAGAYARKRIKDGWWVAWIPAQTAELVMTGLAELADALGLRQQDDTTSTLIARVRNYLHTFTEPALLVFDNVTDPDHVLPHLPAAGSTQIVLTSAMHLDNVGHPVPVEVFTEETAVRFLNRATGLADEAGARELAKELGYLPLALAQAAARVDRDYATYLQRHRTLRLDQVLRARPGDPYPHGMAEAILLAIEPFTGPELELLDLLSVLSPDGVSKALLGDVYEHLDVLCEASLVELAGTDRSVVVMHRLTQRALRDRHDLRAVLDKAAELLASHMFPMEQAWQRRHLGDELIRHIDALCTHASRVVDPPDRLLAARRWAVAQLTESGALDQAIIAGTTALEDHRNLYGDDHPNTIRLINSLSIAYRLAEQPDEAISLLEQNLTVARRVFGAHHPSTLAAANNLANSYESADQLDEAIALLEQNVADCQRELGRYHPDTLLSANNLAVAYHAAGRLEAAITLFEQTLADRHRELGQHHPQTLTSAETLALAYRSAGRVEEAVRLHERNLAHRQQELGQYHPDTLASASSLALSYGFAGRLREAFVLIRQTKVDAERELGRNHSVTRLVHKTLEVLEQFR
jgi:tetratricopeptide (TPR) repeat protein